MTQRQAIHLTKLQLLELFCETFPKIFASAVSSDKTSFKDELLKYIKKASAPKDIIYTLISLIEYDGSIVNELSTGENIHIETISFLHNFLNGHIDGEDDQIDAILDIYNLLLLINRPASTIPNESTVNKWMERWPSGLDDEVKRLREENYLRIIHYLVDKVSSKSNRSTRFRFDEKMTYSEKCEQVKKWWSDYRFHISMAARSPKEINTMLGGTLSRETYALLLVAKHKDMPFFLTPYYASLLNTSKKGYDDYSIRSYVIYSPDLVKTYGNIRAWEKEDIVKADKPNAAGWIVPDPHNIHRRYPDVAILIPDTLGRSCGGLCASCQRMYDFQNKHLNFEFKELLPKESWPHKLHRLMEYFENDSQIRDILITGGDALMSQNKTLSKMLDAVCDMAQRKRKANGHRPDGQKYAEIQRIRLGTRLPVYLPMRIDDALVEILYEARLRGEKAGIKQFVIQTHFQTPLEITPMALEGLNKLKRAGWSINNQLVFNVAASRRGHTAKLRKILQDNGVNSYYTFSVKGFEENHAVYTPNSRSCQEAEEEKIWNKSSDRNVLNLPAIGKSMTFQLVGIMPDGKRILRFDHDDTRKHSPMIEKMGRVYILENKSITNYLRQLDYLGEDIEEYASIWKYTSGKTEKRDKTFEYPDLPFDITDEITNYSEE